jgi:hypothetical protein
MLGTRAHTKRVTVSPTDYDRAGITQSLHRGSRDRGPVALQNLARRGHGISTSRQEILQGNDTALKWPSIPTSNPLIRVPGGHQCVGRIDLNKDVQPLVTRFDLR